MPAAPATASESPRREQIRAAALAAFTENGVAGTSIEEIRARSGASVGSIYHHFGGKDGLAGELYLEGLGDYQRGFLATLAGAESTRVGVEGAVHHHVGWIVEHRDLARFLLLGRDASVVVATERPLRELNRHFFREAGEWIAPRVERRELRDLDTQLLTALWIGPSQELARQWLGGPGGARLTDAAPVLAQAAWTTLRRTDDDDLP